MIVYVLSRNISSEKEDWLSCLRGVYSSEEMANKALEKIAYFSSPEDVENYRIDEFELDHPIGKEDKDYHVSGWLEGTFIFYSAYWQRKGKDV